MTKEKEKEKNYTSEQLSEVLEQLTIDQVRFVVARQEFDTDKDAANEIGVSAQTVYKWPPIVKEAVRLMALDGLATAQHLRRRALAKAMLVKYAGLDSNDERLRQGVATEFIEWEMGKAAQPLTGKDLGPLETNVIVVREVIDSEGDR